MATFVVRDKRDGVLITLESLLGKLPPIQARSYCIRNFRLHYGTPLGLNAIEFEKQTATPQGLCLDADQFQSLISSDFQITEGEIEMLLPPSMGSGSATIACVDASQWDISTQSKDLEAALDRLGFQRE